MTREFMVNTPRRDINLSLSNDQYDDLTSALEGHRAGIQQLADEAKLGFGLDEAYWSNRVTEVQELLDTVHRLARGEDPEELKHAPHAAGDEQL